jgi:NAD-reducing hydrogenase small subunit
MAGLEPPVGEDRKNEDNVETFANIPSIINNGAEWFASMGTETSKGTKVFALAGRINNTGLVEVPMGTSLRSIVFDMDERLIELAGRFELCASPLTDYKDFPEADITLVEGAVANTDHLEHIQTIRKHTKILVSFGDCAVTGNVTAMRNLFSVESVLDRAYRETSAVVNGIPSGDDIVPRLLDRVVPVHEVVPVDYFLQGCPPSADEIYQLLTDLLDGRAPSLDGRRFG